LVAAAFDVRAVSSEILDDFRCPRKAARATLEIRREKTELAWAIFFFN